MLAQNSTQTVQQTNQSAPRPQLQEVVVTGSRIARALNDTLQPTVEISSATFEERGYTNVSQALDELPEFGVPPTSQQNQQSAFSVGQSFVDLYSLGSQRTLTLVDGQRFVSSNTASLAGAASPGSQVDFNVIPVQLIDHIETVSVGGAPIYGADAIAGTVNVILKHDYQGFDMNAMTGVSNDGDAWNYRLSVLGGHNFADGRGNTTTVVEYTKSTGLRGTARTDYTNQGGFEAPATPGTYQLVYTPNPIVNQLSTSGVPYLDNFFYTPGVPDSAIGITNAAGQPLAFSPGSNALTPYNLGQETGNPIFYNGGQGINLVNYSNLQAWTERVNVVSLGHFDWTDNVQSYWNGWFSDSHSHSLISQPLYNATIFGNPGTPNGPIYISTTNPYLSAADQALIQSEMTAYGKSGFPLSGGAPFDPNWNQNYFYLDRGSTDLEAGAFTGDQLVARGVLGLKGDFSEFGQSYHWDVAANYGYSRDISRQPAVVFQNLENAVNPVMNSSGQIVCPRGSGQFIYCDGIGDLRAARYLRRGRPERRREGLHHARRHRRLIQHTTRRHREPQRPHRQAARGLLEVRGRLREPARSGGVRARRLLHLESAGRESQRVLHRRVLSHQRGLRRDPDPDLRAATEHHAAAPGRG